MVAVRLEEGEEFKAGSIRQARVVRQGDSEWLLYSSDSR
jgi:hypothetical protein